MPKGGGAGRERERGETTGKNTKLPLPLGRGVLTDRLGRARRQCGHGITVQCCWCDVVWTPAGHPGPGTTSGEGAAGVLTPNDRQLRPAFHPTRWGGHWIAVHDGWHENCRHPSWTCWLGDNTKGGRPGDAPDVGTGRVAISCWLSWQACRPRMPAQRQVQARRIRLG